MQRREIKLTMGMDSGRRTEEKGGIWSWEGGLVDKVLTVQAWGPEIRARHGGLCL